MKGIVLAGGTGSRLYPLTKHISKQLLMVYDKPMVFYPLSVLMLAGIRDILIISTPQDLPRFQALLGDGRQYGIRLTYAAQPSPDGLAQALLIGENFIGDDCVAVVLGDNLFAGRGLDGQLRAAVTRTVQEGGATVFCCPVKDPRQYGIVTFDAQGKALSIEEKPLDPQSNYCVTGLYFYDHAAVSYAKTLTPSDRGELEITDLNRLYLHQGKLHVELLEKDFLWLDAGTHEALTEASILVETLQAQQRQAVADLEKIASANGWITPSTPKGDGL